MHLLKEGQNIREAYEVERFLGEGAFAEVYRVRHRFLGRQAMKVLKARGTTLDEIQQLLSEALILSGIQHPNVIKVFNADVLEGGSHGTGYFTMEYIAGGSLDKYWRSFQSTAMPISEAVEIIKQVCSGIAVAHAESPPIIHRDIKPQNILIGYDGCGMRVRVSDFGLAKRVNPLTLLATSKGTISFKPPESFDNMDSTAADVWAIGTTFYMLLTDELPFPELEDRDIQDSKQLKRPLRRPSIYNAKVDSELETIVSRSLAFDPKDRYPNARALLEELSKWQSNESDHQPVSEARQESSSAARKSSDIPQPVEAMVQKAIALSRQPGTLITAADLLEEAINKAPHLRYEFESRLKLWRRGVLM